jgi:hypothetical protein
MKRQISGIVSNVSTNPFQTFSKKRGTNSKLLSFDISFDICDEDGQVDHVWFQRSLKFPPPLQDGDRIDVVGKRGHFFGLIGRRNIYAIKIIDKGRQKEYTPWRNKDLRIGQGGQGGSNANATGESSA